MAWTAPMTAVATAAFTASQFNTHVRDNLNETGPAKATAASRWFVSHAANDMRERGIDGETEVTGQTTANSSYSDLATIGPDVTHTTGGYALVFINAHIANNTASTVSHASYEVASATTIAASDVWAIRHQCSTATDDMRAGIAHYQSALNAGGNIFRMKYKVSGGTGTFGSRHIMVMGM